MCVPTLLAALAPAAGAATATGAAAGAATAGAGLFKALQIGGALLSVGGSLAAGIQGQQAARQQGEYIRQQQETETRLNAVEDQRTRLRFQSQIRQQAAELAGRGIRLDSPTAVLLGQVGAREMSFASQAVRSGGQARQAELTSQRRAVLAEGRLSLLRGRTTAAASFLTAAPEIWPGLRGA